MKRSEMDSEILLESACGGVALLCRRGLLAILSELAKCPARHNELARCTGMDSKQLSRALHHALKACLIDRKVDADHMPVRVYYGLTQHGENLVAALAPLAAWYQDHEALYVGHTSRQGPSVL